MGTVYAIIEESAKMNNVVAHYNLNVLHLNFNFSRLPFSLFFKHD